MPAEHGTDEHRGPRVSPAEKRFAHLLVLRSGVAQWQSFSVDVAAHEPYIFCTFSVHLYDTTDALAGRFKVLFRIKLLHFVVYVIAA